MPPIANQGIAAANRGRVADQLDARRGATLLRRRLPHRSRADLIGPRVARCGQRGVELLRRVGGEADERAGTRLGPRLGHGHVVLADVNAVGAACLDQLGVVVQEEERAVAIGGAAKRLRQGDDLLGAPRRLLAQLDQVGAATERRIEERLGIAVAWPRVADEVKARGLKADQA